MEWVIIIPPEGSIVRDLVISSLSVFTDYEYFNADVKYNGNELVVETSENFFISFLKDMFETSLKNIALKEELGVYFPGIHKNDKQTLNKIFEAVGIQVPNGDYLSYIKYMIQWAKDDIVKNGERWIDQLSIIKVKGDNIKLGDGKYTNLQPFKIEKYEYGKGFGTFTVKFDYKMSREWMALVLAGFSLSYGYYAGGEIILSPLPESVFIKALEDYNFKEHVKVLTGEGRVSKAFYGEKGIYNVISKVRVRPSPVVAYILLLGLQTYLDYHEKGILEIPSYNVIRILYTGKSFTMLEKIGINVEPVMKFAYKLANCTNDPERVLNILINFLFCTIRLSSGKQDYCSRMYGDYMTCYRITQLLYQSIVGSRRPEELVYLMARITPEKSPLKYNDLLKGIYDALSD